MLTFTQGDLFEANAEALVNAVNTAGVMGKGIALVFKQTFPDNYDAYRVACKANRVRTGSMFFTERDGGGNPKWIVNFPTKEHWRSRSKFEWIADGLDDLRRVIKDQHIRSVALPSLGAGHGGLPWKQVRKLIEEKLAGLSDVKVTVYEPFSDSA